MYTSSSWLSIGGRGGVDEAGVRGTLSTTSSRSSRIAVTVFTAATFKGVGFMCVEVIAIRSESGVVGWMFRKGDTKYVSLYLRNWSIIQGVPGGSFPIQACSWRHVIWKEGLRWINLTSLSPVTNITLLLLSLYCNLLQRNNLGWQKIVFDVDVHVISTDK